MFEEIIAPLFSTEWGRRSGLAAMVIFSLFLLITLIEAPFAWHSDYTLAHNQATTTKTQSSTDQTMALIMQIPDKHLFGASMQAANLPITSLQLQLLGVIQSNPAGASRVIISEAGQPGKIYQVGDSVSPGVHIKAITADGVILENGSHAEKLPLSRQPLLFKGSPKNVLLREQ